MGPNYNASAARVTVPTAGLRTVPHCSAPAFQLFLNNIPTYMQALDAWRCRDGDEHSVESSSSPAD